MREGLCQARFYLPPGFRWMKAGGSAGCGPEGLWTTLICLHACRFKGSSELLSMWMALSYLCYYLRPSRFPAEPPRGKGDRVSESSGVVATGRMPTLKVVELYRTGFMLRDQATGSGIPGYGRSSRSNSALPPLTQ